MNQLGLPPQANEELLEKASTGAISGSTSPTQASSSTNSISNNNNNNSKFPTNPQDSSGQKDWWEGGSMANSDDNDSGYFYSDDSTTNFDEDETCGTAPPAEAADTMMENASQSLINVNVSSPASKRSHPDDGALPPSRNDNNSMMVIENDVKPENKQQKPLSFTGATAVPAPAPTCSSAAQQAHRFFLQQQRLRQQRLQHQRLRHPVDAGAFLSKSFAEIIKGKAPSERVYFVPEFLEQCTTKAFLSFVSENGLQNSSFKPNPDAVAGKAIHDRFVEACCKNLPEYATLAIAFHGTGEDNIPHILKDGLDPKKRRGQAYGPGEYFSTDPGVSTSYCRKSSTPSQQNISGGKMLVFLVVRPLYQHDEINGRPRTICPPHYVVVPTTEHQLPLGVLSYESIEQASLQRANAMRAKLQLLHQELQQKEHRANLAKLKAKVIQKIINDEMDVAGEFYAKHCKHLDIDAKKAISTYAHMKYKYDTDFISFYFPDLPSPMTAEEEEKMVSVEALEQEVLAKQMELEKQSKVGTGAFNK